jgi:hypothetical protein
MIDPHRLQPILDRETECDEKQPYGPFEASVTNDVCVRDNDGPNKPATADQRGG